MNPNEELQSVISDFASAKAVLDDLLDVKPEIIEEFSQEAKILFAVSDGTWVEIAKADISTSTTEVTYKLGTSPLPNEVRWHMHSRFDIRWEVRQCEAEVFVRFRHPTLDQYIDDAVTCTGIASLASVISAVAAGNIAAGYAIFYPAWRACMLTKLAASIVNDFQIELFPVSRCGCWEYHC